MQFRKVPSKPKINVFLIVFYYLYTHYFLHYFFNFQPTIHLYFHFFTTSLTFEETKMRFYFFLRTSLEQLFQQARNYFFFQTKACFLKCQIGTCKNPKTVINFWKNKTNPNQEIMGIYAALKIVALLFRNSDGIISLEVVKNSWNHFSQKKISAPGTNITVHNYLNSWLLGIFFSPLGLKISKLKFQILNPIGTLQKFEVWGDQ